MKGILPRNLIKQVRGLWCWPLPGAQVVFHGYLQHTRRSAGLRMEHKSVALCLFRRDGVCALTGLFPRRDTQRPPTAGEDISQASGQGSPRSGPNRCTRRSLSLQPENALLSIPASGFGFLHVRSALPSPERHPFPLHLHRPTSCFGFSLEPQLKCNLLLEAFPSIWR